MVGVRTVFVAGYLDRPRATLLRRVFFYAHLTAGLVVGLVLLAVGLSGSVLVFRPEIERALTREYRVVEPGPARLRLSAIAETAAAAYPSKRLSRVLMPRDGREAVEVVLQARNAATLKAAQLVSVFVDPYRGSILGTREKQAGWLYALQDFHFAFWSELPGLIANGLGAAIMLLLGVTGIAVWWQGRPQWTRGFRVSLRGNWKRTAWDLHSAVGIFMVAGLSILSATGIYYAFREPVTNLVMWVTRGVPAPPAPTGTATTRPAAFLDEALAHAQAALPEATITELRFGRSATAPLSVTARLPGDPGDGRSRVHLDAATGAVVRVDRFDSLSLGARVIQSIEAVHYGYYAGWPNRALWFLIGLSPAVLWFTGAVVWYQRTIVPRWRRSQTSETLRPNSDAPSIPMRDQQTGRMS